FERLGLARNVTASRSRLALAFATTPVELLQEVLRRLRAKGEVVAAERAACQEVIEKDPDLTALPVHLQHGLDGAPYISASVDINAPSDLRALYQSAVGKGERMPLAFAVGSHPCDFLAAVAATEPINELEVIGAVRSAPLPVV